MLRNFVKRVHLFLKKKFDQNGSVLIEFAFCCPLLVIILLFVLDVPLAYRVLMKMQKMSELTASMIRSVPSKNETLITMEDLKNISKAAGITMTGRLGSAEEPCKRYPFYLSTYVFCIEGNDSGGFNKKWNVHIMNNLYNGEITPIPNDSSLTYSKFKEVSDFSMIDEFSNYAIQEGEVKLIVETVAWYNESISSIQEGVIDDSVNGNSGTTQGGATGNSSGEGSGATQGGATGNSSGEGSGTTQGGATGNSNGEGSSMFGDYNKNKRTVRGFNKNFYLMTVPGRTVSTREKAFGNKYAIMSCVDEIIDPENCPE